MDDSPREKKQMGCCIMLLFRRWPRRSASSNSISPTTCNNGLKLTSSNSKRRWSGCDDVTFLNSAKLSDTPTTVVEKPITKSPLNTRTNPPQYQSIGRKPPSNGISSALTLSVPGGLTKAGTGQMQKNPSISRELENLISDHRGKGDSTLVRASSTNMMVFGNLGNIRHPGNGKASSPSNCMNALDYLPMTAHEMALNKKGGNRNGVVMENMNTIKAAEKDNVEEAEGVFCRALSRRLDPEELKAMGNDEYKKGNFVKALALYDQAITLDPDRASYRSNKSAALIGLGRLLEAVDECREAVRLEPSYSRAHHRLASLYLRLGEAEKAQKHFKLSGTEANSKEMALAQSLRTHLLKCKEARKLMDWHTMLKEAGCAVSSGADSAPQVFASQAEALLKLCRHDEADTTLSCAPFLDTEASTKFFGVAGNGYFFLIRAQVDMAAGRFEKAMAMAQQAARLDPSNKEFGIVVRRTRAVASARSNGNELFKASKFSEACKAYGQGLEHNTYNAVLLCNRAACRSKLGQFEKAVEDCTLALNMRPSYSKARLRRADCNAKLERWEASIQDYQMLIREVPGDDEVRQALVEAEAELKKQCCKDSKDMKLKTDMIITSNDCYT